MNNLRFLSILLCFSTFASCTKASKPENATIIGTADFKNQWLYLVKPDPWLLKANIVDSSKIDENGNFSFEANVPEMAEFLISGRGFFLTTVFLENGSVLQIDVKGRGNKGNGRVITFTGEGSEINNFWLNITNRFFKQGGYGNKYKKLVANNEPMQFAVAYDAFVQLQQDALDSFVKEAKPDSYFANWAKSFIGYSALSKRFTYLFHKPRSTNSASNYMRVDDAYYEFLKEIDFKKAPEIVHSAYNDFIYFYIVDYKARNLSGAADAVLGSISYAKTELPQDVANIAVAHVIKDLINSAETREDYDRLRLAMDDFKAWPNAEKYTSFLDASYNEKAVLAPGSPAPDFTLKNIDNEDVAISSFKGKVVVIDFWGTWCGPCKRELPYSREIETFFADRDDVIFVFVALERGSRDYWKEFVVSNDLPGEHLYSANDNRSLMPYKITSVPRYVLIDKEGNIYDAFASRPSQNMQQQIAKVLEL